MIRFVKKKLAIIIQGELETKVDKLNSLMLHYKVVEDVHQLVMRDIQESQKDALIDWNTLPYLLCSLTTILAQNSFGSILKGRVQKALIENYIKT